MKLGFASSFTKLRLRVYCELDTHCYLCRRYPSFIDALRDMDDPLTMLHLFATLPADNVHKIPVERVQIARR